jgi:hypothetical protein
MREDFQIPNFGEGPVSYEKGYLNRLVRNIEMTFRSLKAKGPINATTVAADSMTVGGLTVPGAETGTWTPVVTFASPGDTNVVLGATGGSYVKTGNQVTVWLILNTTTFTHTTASGEFRVSGLPFAAAASSRITGSLELQGFDDWKGGTQANVNIPANASYMRVIVTAAGLARQALTATEHTSGDNLGIVAVVTYETQN